SLHNMKYNEHKIIATRYAEELTNFIKNEKDINWMIFTTHGDSSGINYCFNNNSSLAWTDNTNCGSSFALNSMYKRFATITTNGTPVSSVDVVVDVSWRETTIRSVKINSIYQVWE
ncbi:MAG: hypothetical protein Q7R95_05595, partial [bacterium]|nr:hypothetical protein [bacterium]